MVVIDKQVYPKNIIMEKFDLTTDQGRNEATKYFDRFGWILSPPIWLLYRILRPRPRSRSRIIHQQSRMAAELIKAGSRNNVDEMEITINNDAGGRFYFGVGNSEGVMPNIKANIGTNDKMTIRVKYK